MHEKGLQRQIGVGTLVSGQAQKAVLVPLKNRGYTVDQPVVNCWSTAGFVPLSFLSTNSIDRASEEMFRTVVFVTLVGTKDKCIQGGPNRRRPFRPGDAPPRPDPPVICPGFRLGK